MVKLGTRRLPLAEELIEAVDGPCAGHKFLLTEWSGNTGWIEVNGMIGRYISKGIGPLRWEQKK